MKPVDVEGRKLKLAIEKRTLVKHQVVAERLEAKAKAARERASVTASRIAELETLINTLTPSNN